MYRSVSFCLLLALIASAAVLDERAPSPSPSPISVPLLRRRPARTLAEGRAFAQRAIARSKLSVGTSRQKRQTSVPLSDVLEALGGGDGAYSAQILVGTPRQHLNVILDTASSDLWLVGSQCPSGCGSIIVFNENASSTFQASTSNQLIELDEDSTPSSSTVNGTLASDTVTFGGYTDSQSFVDVTQLAGDLTPSLSGALGLAWPALSRTNSTPLVIELVNNLPQPLMSLFLTRYGDDTQKQNGTELPNGEFNPPIELGGEFMLGGTNSSLYTGSIEYHNIQQVDGVNTFWSLEMSSMTVAGKSLSLGADNVAMIATTSPFILGPSNLVQGFYENIPGSEPTAALFSGGLTYTYPCDPPTAVSISFGGVSWPISPDDLAFFRGSNNTCIGSVIGADIDQENGAPPWVLGTPFLKNVYSVFRYSPASVGFAQLSSTAIGQDPEGSAGAAGIVSTVTFTGSATQAASATPSQNSGAGAGKAVREVWWSVGVVTLSMIVGLTLL